MKKTGCILLILLTVQCRERYNVPLSTPQTNYLVVEGMINPLGKTKINLSRTAPLNSSVNITETGASVQIEGEDNSLYYLQDQGTGSYLSDSVILNAAIRYRLHLTTAAGREYVSTFQSPIYTPPVDSVSWKRDNGIELFINTHDPNNALHYYKWDYDETWEIHSAYRTPLKFKLDTDSGNATKISIEEYDNGRTDDSIYYCWQSNRSTEIVLGSTAGLTSDVLYKSLKSYRDTAIQFSVLYSVALRQHALSKEAFEFFQKLKKNSETLGSIFDAQPSEIKGNLTCVNDPKELVIGFVDVSSLTETRKFIDHRELPNWRYDDNCPPLMMFKNDPDTIATMYFSGFFPVEALFVQGALVAYNADPRECVVCTVSGTNIKPDFWP